MKLIGNHQKLIKIREKRRNAGIKMLNAVLNKDNMLEEHMVIQLIKRKDNQKDAKTNLKLYFLHRKNHLMIKLLNY